MSIKNAVFGPREGKVNFVLTANVGKWIWKFYCDDYNVFASQSFNHISHAQDHFRECGGRMIALAHGEE